MQDTTVPAIPQPVRQLKERFTLNGEPLPISVCMKKLGLELDKQNGNHFCFWPVYEDTQYVLIYSGDHWEESTYKVDAETYDAQPVTEADVLMKLIRRHYMLRMKKDKLNPSDEVVKSLSARLVPLATQDQLDALRADIRNIRA
jgi:hypothetical protein